ncbi:hypothetical protein [Brevibacillus laterosporus]
MSFDLDINSILQFAYNIFASAQGLLGLFVAGSFAFFMLTKLIGIFK